MHILLFKKDDISTWKRILCTVGLSSSEFFLCPFTFSFHEYSWLNIAKKVLLVWCHQNEQSVVIGGSQNATKTCSMEALSIVMQQFLLWKLYDATFLVILCEARCHFLPFFAQLFFCEGTGEWCEGQRRKRLLKEPFSTPPSSDRETSLSMGFLGWADWLVG